MSTFRKRVLVIGFIKGLKQKLIFSTLKKEGILKQIKVKINKYSWNIGSETIINIKKESI